MRILEKLREWKFRFNVGLTNLLYDFKIVFDKKNYNKYNDTIREIHIGYNKFPITIKCALLDEKPRQYIEEVIKAFKYIQLNKMHKNIFATLNWYIDDDYQNTMIQMNAIHKDDIDIYYFSISKNSVVDILYNLPFYEIIVYLHYAANYRKIELPEEFSHVPKGEHYILNIYDRYHPFKFVKLHNKLIITRYRLVDELHYIPAFIIIDNNDKIDFENFRFIYRYYISEEHDYNILFIEQLSDIPMAVLDQKL